MVFALALFASLVAQASASWEHGVYDDVLGSRSYAVYTPAKLRAPAPMILFLHGCNESPEEFAGGARIAEAAEKRGAFILLPEQTQESNPERCWNWFLPVNQLRESGESGLLAHLTSKIVRNYPIDPSRVFVAGLSSGGGMADILASCYPEIFSAVAIHSGMSYRAAVDPTTALWSIAHGSVTESHLAGNLSQACSGNQHRPMPLLLIQGSEDTRVAPINADQILAQFARYNDWPDDSIKHPEIETGQVAAGYRFEIRRFERSPELEQISVFGMAHAWSGGDPAFPHTDAKGPDFTTMLFDFFETQKGQGR